MYHSLNIKMSIRLVTGKLAIKIKSIQLLQYQKESTILNSLLIELFKLAYCISNYEVAEQ